MALTDQIKFIQNLPNGGLKFQVLQSLNQIKDHIPFSSGDSVVVGMSGEDYKKFLEFKEYNEYMKKKNKPPVPGKKSNKQ